MRKTMLSLDIYWLPDFICKNSRISVGLCCNFIETYFRWMLELKNSVVLTTNRM
jgi:hypothetical protein